jgi:predicted HTH domain antitoxin
MTVKSLRIPEEMEKAIEYVAKSEKIEKSQSLRKLTRIGFECYVAKSYEQGRLTLREAAKLLRLSLSETVDILSETGVKGNIRSSDVLESLKLARTARRN